MCVIAFTYVLTDLCDWVHVRALTDLCDCVHVYVLTGACHKLRH